MPLKKNNTLSENRPHKGITVDTHIFLCILLLALGTGVRLYNLGGESIDLEEYACVSALGTPDFSAFFEQQRDLYPYGAPLTPALFYFWTKIAGDSIAHIRLLSALAGIAVMFLGYCATRLLFQPSALSRKAALVVLTCITFSPVHVFHSQEARMYAFVSLFTLCGMITFLLGLRTQHLRWWFLHLLSNGALVFSHYFAVFLLPVYGVVLLLAERRLNFRAFLWGLSHGLLMVVLVAWVSAIPQQAEELYSYYELPTPSTVFIHTFSGDSTSLSATSFFPSTVSWYFMPAPFQQWIRDNHTIFDGLLVLLSLTSLCAGFWFLIQGFKKREREAVLRWALLLCWALLPVASITLLSFVWRPVYGSRYVMYSMFAFYLLAGGMIGLLTRKRLYPSGLVFIGILYLYQLSIALPPQTRSAWRQNYEHVIQSKETDAILLLEDPFFLPVLKINIEGTPPVPIVAAFNRGTLCETASLLCMPSNDTMPEIWILLVLTTDFDETTFMSCLKNNHLAYERRYSPGERDLALYRISPSNFSATETIEEDGKTIFNNLINKLAQNASLPLIHHTMKEIQYLPDEEGGFWLRLGIESSIAGYTDLAASAFAKATQSSLVAATRVSALATSLDVVLNLEQLANIALRNPGTSSCDQLKKYMPTAFYTDNTPFIAALGKFGAEPSLACPESFLYLGIAAHKSGDHQKAVHFFQQYTGMVHNMPPEVIEAYGISLTETKSYEQAVLLLKDGIEEWPEYRWLYMRLGIAEAALGNHHAAESALRVALDHAPDNAYILYLLMNSLVALGNYEEAALLADNPVLQAEQDSWVLWARWRSFTGAGQDSAGREVFETLADMMPELLPFYKSYYVDANPARIRELMDQLDDEDARHIFPEAFMLLDRLQ